MNLTADQERYWRAYLAHAAVAPSDSSNVTASQPGGAEIADTLIALYLQGTKTAGSGLVEDYVTAGDPLPQVGDHWIALDSRGLPRCILRTVRVETHKFLDVPARIAVAEGKGTCPSAIGELRTLSTTPRTSQSGDLLGSRTRRSSPSSSNSSTRRPNPALESTSLGMNAPASGTSHPSRPTGPTRAAGSRIGYHAGYLSALR